MNRLNFQDGWDLVSIPEKDWFLQGNVTLPDGTVVSVGGGAGNTVDGYKVPGSCPGCAQAKSQLPLLLIVGLVAYFIFKD